MRHSLAVVLFTLLTTGTILSRAQDAQQPAQATPPPASRHLFFAGTVTELDDQHVTVSRNVVGRAPEQRTFLIKPETKMNKSALKLKSRVTVRYQHMPEGEVALEIQIRPPVHPPKTT